MASLCFVAREKSFSLMAVVTVSQIRLKKLHLHPKERLTARIPIAFWPKFLRVAGAAVHLTLAVDHGSGVDELVAIGAFEAELVV